MAAFMKSCRTLYGAQWYTSKSDSISYGRSVGHKYFVMRVERYRGEDVTVYGSYESFNSHKKAIKYEDAKELRLSTWKEEPILEDDTDDTFGDVVFEDTSEDSTTRATTVVSVVGSPEPEILVDIIHTPPSSIEETIKMISRGDMGISDYLRSVHTGKMAFFYGTDSKIKGYKYNNESCVWEIGTMFNIGEIVRRELLVVLKTCKVHLQFDSVLSSSEIKKRVKKLKEQKRIVYSHRRYGVIWDRHVQGLLRPSFTDLLCVLITTWCPLNDKTCINVGTGDIRKIEPTDYFIRYIDVDSSGNTSHLGCREFFMNVVNKRKNEASLLVDLRDILNNEYSHLEPPPKFDHLKAFLSDCLVKVDIDVNASVLFKTLYNCYQYYCTQNRYKVVSRKKLALMVVKYGYNKEKKGQDVVVTDVVTTDKYACALKGSPHKVV